MCPRRRGAGLLATSSPTTSTFVTNHDTARCASIPRALASTIELFATARGRASQGRPTARGHRGATSGFGSRRPSSWRCNEWIAATARWPRPRKLVSGSRPVPEVGGGPGRKLARTARQNISKHLDRGAQRFSLFTDGGISVAQAVEQLDPHRLAQNAEALRGRWRSGCTSPRRTLEISLTAAIRSPASLGRAAAGRLDAAYPTPTSAWASQSVWRWSPSTCSSRIECAALELAETSALELRLARGCPQINCLLARAMLGRRSGLADECVEGAGEQAKQRR